ncbi:FkbM family methyltransferase [Rhodobacterales bacterium HKCCE3408]|nr:FkbM family methyltransferase [Rhodobacterales bacterium HKCCE3408]
MGESLESIASAEGALPRLLADDSVNPVLRAALGRPARYVTPAGAQVVLSHRYDKPVQFLVNNPEDRIHAVQTKGAFYEIDQLQVMARNMPQGGVFLDIGANIGNHTLYMLMFGGAARSIPVEPNPAAVELLAGVLLLNGLIDRVDPGGLGLGMGARSEAGFAIHWPKGNLGWGKLKKAGGGDGVAVLAGDDLVGDGPVDLIKIDVEGMELDVLEGLRSTVARCRPPIFIEVDRHNRDAFFALMTEWDYVIAEEFGARRVNQNLLMRPAERPAHG